MKPDIKVGVDSGKPGTSLAALIDSSSIFIG
jgi:hypothetical protein